MRPAFQVCVWRKERWKNISIWKVQRYIYQTPHRTRSHSFPKFDMREAKTGWENWLGVLRTVFLQRSFHHAFLGNVLRHVFRVWFITYKAPRQWLECRITCSFPLLRPSSKEWTQQKTSLLQQTHSWRHQLFIREKQNVAEILPSGVLANETLYRLELTSLRAVLGL